MNFLEEAKYKKYTTNSDSIGVKEEYQKRIDTNEEYGHYPLCQCNDKLFLNVSKFDYSINGEQFLSYEMFLVHENKDGNWCDLKIYSLSEEEISANLPKLEKKLLDMWVVFYGEQK